MTTEERIAHIRELLNENSEVDCLVVQYMDLAWLLHQEETMRTAWVNEYAITKQLTAEREQLAAAIARVREVHKPFTRDGDLYCISVTCGDGHYESPWPCPTINALNSQGAT